MIDSGPARLSSSTIAALLEGLEQSAEADGCTTTQWAGTYLRGRTPRLLGETFDGRVVEGGSITAATVDGVPFAASLASGGRFVGETASGTGIQGYFARVNPRKAVWYGVERTCPDE